MKRRVVITGLGVVTPLACNVDLLWERILAGQSGIHPITILDTAPHKVKFGGDVADFDPGHTVDAKEAKRLDRFTLFALHAAHQAMADSGIDMSKEDPFRCGAIIGSGIGGLNEIEEQMERLFTKGPDRVSPFTIPKMMLNAAGGNIAIAHGLRGPNFATATACASATNAMGDALKTIQYDDAEVVLTGGSEAAITAMGLAGFANMKALSTRHDAPEKASRPFDADRDGFVLAEGLECSFLKSTSMQNAVARGSMPRYLDLAEAVTRGISPSQTRRGQGPLKRCAMPCETPRSMLRKWTTSTHMEPAHRSVTRQKRKPSRQCLPKLRDRSPSQAPRGIWDIRSALAAESKWCSP